MRSHGRDRARLRLYPTHHGDVPEMVTFGYDDRPAHEPSGGKVEQVRATFMAEQSHLPPGQRPSVDSDEQAMYGLDVSYEIPVPVDFEIC